MGMERSLQSVPAAGAALTRSAGHAPARSAQQPYHASFAPSLSIVGHVCLGFQRLGVGPAAAKCTGGRALGREARLGAQCRSGNHAAVLICPEAATHSPASASVCPAQSLIADYFSSLRSVGAHACDACVRRAPGCPMHDMHILPPDPPAVPARSLPAGLPPAQPRQGIWGAVPHVCYRRHAG